MKKFVLKTIVFYKKNLSRPGYCRFSPTCSLYAYEAIEKEGLLKGGVKSIKRILKCNSFFTPTAGTYDPVV